MSLVFMFHKNGSVFDITHQSACLEDPSGAQVQYNEGNTSLGLSILGCNDISMEEGFLSLGSFPESCKIWCKYSKGVFYFVVWYLYKDEYHGMFGISKDLKVRTSVSGKNFLKFINEFPPLSIDKFLRKEIIPSIIQRSRK